MTTLTRLLLPAALLLASTTAHASLSEQMDGEGNYTVPVSDDRLEPYSHFTINEYKVRMNGDGRHVMTYDLPLDLTGGQRVTVTMTETNPGRAAGDPIKLEGPKGETTCRQRDEDSDWDDLDCEITFRNLGVTRGQSDDYLARKYRGQAKEGPAKEVAQRFLFQPIGAVGTQPLDNDCHCSRGNGAWKVRYQSPQGQWVDADMTLDRLAGSYWTTGGSGVLTEVSYPENDVAEGLWSYGGSKGWFRFHFEGRDRFTGQWGVGDQIGQQRRGQWNGKRVFLP